MSSEFFARLDQDDIDSLFEDYYEKTSRPIKEKKGIVLFIEILLQSAPDDPLGEELVGTLKDLDVPKFITIIKKTEKYRNLLYRCASF